jgi:hypothetical protein
MIERGMVHDRWLGPSPRGDLPLKDSTIGGRLEAHGRPAGGLKQRRSGVWSRCN